MRFVGLGVVALFAVGCGRSSELVPFSTGTSVDLAGGEIQDLALTTDGGRRRADMGERADMGRNRSDMGRGGSDMGRNRSDMGRNRVDLGQPPVDLAVPDDLATPIDLATPSSCTRDDQCPGERCDWLTGQCVPIEGCMNDRNCPSGEACIGGQCLPIETCAPFGGGGSCPSGTHCQFPPGVCAPDPNCGGGCPSGERCVAGFCQPDGCTSASQCNDGYDCVGGRCEPRRYCSVLQRCPGNERCVAHVCTP